VIRHASSALLVLLSSCVSASGCTCKRSPRADDAGVAASPDAPTDGSNTTWRETDMQLTRTALVAFGNTTPLPVSQEFIEEVPALDPPLTRVAGVRAGKPVRVRVERDVPYGQLTRMMQAGIGARIAMWEVVSTTWTGEVTSVELPPPGPIPRGDCWTRAWIGPDRRVQIYLDMKGVIVNAKDGRPDFDGFLTTLRRLDAKCAAGNPGNLVRLYTQPSAVFGPVFDLARAIVTATPKPNVSIVQFQVPSLAALDSPEEVFKK